MKILYIIFFVSTLFFGSSLINNIYASHKIFTENFDSNLEGSFPSGWQIVYEQDQTPCLANWVVHNGMAGISINQSSCSTNIIPNDTKWNNLGNNYSFEFDMKFVSGVDHNVAFRFTQIDPKNTWYELHFQSPGDFVLDRVSNGTYNTFIAGSYPNGQTYHIKIEVNSNNIKVFVNNSLMRDYTSNIDSFPAGRIALRAGAGSNPISETYFDNIVVTSIDDINFLPVPYFNQNSTPWGMSEYDSAASLGFANPNFERWGCAVTSAAMVLNYHGMTQLQDNTPLNPGTLNNWLNNNNGYLTGTGADGPYSYIDWPAISKLSKDLFDSGKSTVKLMHKQAYPSVATDQLINDDLTNGKFPDILQVKNASTSGHFVVAKGILNNAYAVNDPEWDVADLSSFNNTYYQVDRYIPSQTNLSYIVLAVNPNVDVLVTDQQGNRTGKQHTNGQTTTFNEIPNATYTFEDPISNPNTQNSPEQLGTGVNVFLLPEPTDGNYQFTASSNSQQGYTLNVAVFDENGENMVFKPVGNVSAQDTDSFTINYSQQTLPAQTSVITYESTIKDILDAQNNNQITKGSVANALVRTINQAQDADFSGNTDATLRRLNHFEAILNRNHENNIDNIAYQILLSDVTFLKNNL